MLWIEIENYWGPDRRHRKTLRLRERRRVNLAAAPPPLATTLRQLHMHILDAQGEHIDAFVARAQSASALARMQGEDRAAALLLNLAAIAADRRDGDLREALYRALDRARAALRVVN